MFDSPEGGNAGQFENIEKKVDGFVTTRMRNGKLPSYMGSMAYKFKLWASIRYGIGTMTNE